MKIEQTSPNKPNFLLVVLLSAATILLIFVFAYFVLDFEGGHLTFRHHTRHPTSTLIMPGPSPSRDQMG